MLQRLNPLPFRELTLAHNILTYIQFGVLRWIGYEKCEAIIPDHLAERWDDLTEESAKKEWRNTYRELVLNSDGEFFT